MPLRFGFNNTLMRTCVCEGVVHLKKQPVHTLHILLRPLTTRADLKQLMHYTFCADLAPLLQTLQRLCGPCASCPNLLLANVLQTFETYLLQRV